LNTCDLLEYSEHRPIIEQGRLPGQIAIILVLRGTITNDHKLSDLKQEKLILTVLEARVPKPRCQLGFTVKCLFHHGAPKERVFQALPAWLGGCQ
jgi:hypothetical protein